jgi:hypothetical protein
MNNKIFSALSLLLIIPVLVYGQDDNLKSKEIGLSIFSAEMNGETLNHETEPKFIIGPYFNKYFNNISWITSVEAGINNINDDCQSCADSFYGLATLTELSISSGARYTFLRKNELPLKPFVESDIYYTFSNYQGSFQGGLSGDGTLRDSNYNSAGIIGRAGLSIYLTKSFSISLSASLKYGYVNSNNKLTGEKDNYIGFTTITPFQLRAAYLF